MFLSLLFTFNLYATECPFPIVAQNVTPLEMGVDSGDIAGKEVVRCYDTPSIKFGKRLDPNGKICVRNMGQTTTFLCQRDTYTLTGVHFAQWSEMTIGQMSAMFTPETTVHTALIGILHSYLAVFPKNIQAYLDGKRCADEIELGYPTSKGCLPPVTKPAPIAQTLTAPVEDITPTN